MGHGDVRVESKSYIFLGIFVVAVLFGYGVWSSLSDPIPDYSEPPVPDHVYPVQGHVAIEFRVQNRTRRQLDGAELRFTLPAKQTSSQLVKQVSSSSSAFVQVLPAQNGNQEAFFQFESIVPREVLDIRIGLDLRFSDTLIPGDSGDESPYLADDPMLGLKNPDVQALAARLADEDMEISVGNILAWLEKNGQEPDPAPGNPDAGFTRPVTAEHATEDLAVSEILAGQGHTSQDTLYLFLALTRAMEVPSRIIVGLKVSDEQADVYTFDDLIVYPEILLDADWRAVDLESHRLIERPNVLTLKRLAAMPARQQVLQPYRLLFQSVGIEFVLGSEKYRLSFGDTVLANG